MRALLLGLIFVFLTSCSHGPTRSLAHSPDAVNVFQQGISPFTIAPALTDIDFSNSKQIDQSVVRLQAYLNQYRQLFFAKPNTAPIAPLDFLPLDQASLTFGPQNITLRLKQAVNPVGNLNPNKKIPIEGADLTATFYQGRLLLLNSALTSTQAPPLLPEPALRPEASFTPEDQAALFYVLDSLKNEETAESRLKSGLGDSTRSLLEFFKTKAFKRFWAQIPPFQRQLVLARAHDQSPYELAWKISRPLDLPVHLYWRAGPTSQLRLLKTTRTEHHATILIYENTKRQFRAKELVVGDSKIHASQAYQPEDPAHLELLKTLARVVETYHEQFSWNSFNNKGDPVVASLNHKIKRLRDNAAWTGEPYNTFLIGTGGSELHRFTGSIDVLAHEYCHAIVDQTAQFAMADQPGALNEHLCDLLGAGIKSDATKSPYANSIGIGVVKKDPNRPLRDFLDPMRSYAEQPSHMAEVFVRYGNRCVPTPKNDDCGVHYQAGVPNLAMGRSIKALGWEKVRPLLFNVLTSRLRSASQFTDYRTQVFAECQSLNYPESDCQVFLDEFDRVGITDPQSAHPPSPPGLSSPASGCTDTLKEVCKLLRESGVPSTDVCVACGFD